MPATHLTHRPDMSLSAQQIGELSRLLDRALDLPPGEREAWMGALPASQQPLLEPLRQMLARHAAESVAAGLISTLPRIADDVAAAAPGDRLGPYRLVREIGRGGMGSVWLAERVDGIFQRQVALKLPHLSHSPRLAERMAQERQIGALLEHPNIARLYDAGIADGGRPYLVMEWVQGTDLIDHATRQQLDRRQRLRLMLQVCAAVAHAHRQLVVHRDLKPNNLLVDLDGQVKLLDFGIARLLDDTGSGAGDDSGRTRTPAYSAPEQTRGGPISTATDIYSLGVVLQRLLTGAMPGADAEVGRNLDADTSAVLQCALRERPEERYSSVERFADDIQRLLSNRPVAADPGSRWHRLMLFGRRNRIGLGAGALAACAIAIFAAVLLQQRARERIQEQRAVQAREFLFEMLDDAEPAAGQTAAEVTGAQMVQDALVRARKGFVGQPVLRGQVLTELGIMLRRLGQPAQALAVLQEANGLLQASAAADDPARHIGAAQLAIQLHIEGTPEQERQAKSLAEQAIAGCSADTPRCARARAFAHDVLMWQANQRGDRAVALQQGRLKVSANERGFGANDPEVVSALVGLAIVSRNAGALPDAAAALDRAKAIASHAVLRAADLYDLRLYDALVSSDLGHYDPARRTYEQLIADVADSSRPALPLRLLAELLIAQGQLPDALASADRALGSAQQPGQGRAPDDWEATFAHQARARALSGLGRYDEARQEIAKTQEGLRQLGLPQEGLEWLRARRFSGEIELRAGHVEAARTLLEPLPFAHRRDAKAAVLSPADLAQALDLLGTLARQTGDLKGAIAMHREAAQWLKASLPAQHPLAARNALLEAIAEWLNGGRADRSPLNQAVARYLEFLPADSAWRRLPDATSGSEMEWKNFFL